MKKKKSLLPYLIYVAFCLLSLSLLNDNRAYAFTGQVIQQGAVGEDVIELQSQAHTYRVLPWED